jgi:hypothetical protein
MSPSRWYPMSDPMVSSRQPQTRFHREATNPMAQWPTPAGRHWLLTYHFLVIVIASHVAGAGEKHHGLSPNEYPRQHWTQVKRPEDRGWSSDKLAAAKAYADSIDTAAVIIVDDGVIISQWDATATKFKVHSIRKSFLSALYGIAVAHGEINLNVTLEQIRLLVVGCGKRESLSEC